MNNILRSGLAWAVSLTDAIASHLRDEQAQDLVEYAVLAGMLGVVVVGIMWAVDQVGIGTELSDSIKNCISFGATGNCGP